MRELTATILTTTFLAGGVGAGAALAAPVHHGGDAVRTEQRDRTQQRSHHVERAHSDREAGRAR